MKQDRAIAISPEEFSECMARFAPFEHRPTVAVAVSGGRDSMTLAFLVAQWCRHCDGQMQPIIIDHGLRPSSSLEASQASENLSSWDTMPAVILKSSLSSKSNLQARARELRYHLLENYCQSLDILHLLVAHHGDDQAETLLLRLGRGSGVYGLAGMTPLSYGKKTRILRPLLFIPQSRLHATQTLHAIPHVEDDSNHNKKFARVRLRENKLTLAELGLTQERMVATSQRLRRARITLEKNCAIALVESVTLSPLGFASCHEKRLFAHEDEIQLRVLASLLQTIGGNNVMPRLEAVMRLRDAIKHKKERTLHGCLIHRRNNNDNDNSNDNDNGVWLFCREPSLIKDNSSLDASSPFLWDRRFCISYEKSSSALFIKALRTRGWHLIKNDCPRSLPRQGIESLPALWNDKDELLSVPSLAIVLQKSAIRHRVRAYFEPCATLTPLS